MSETLEARIVKIDLEHDAKTGCIWATSDDVRGLVIGRPTLDELEAELPSAIQEMYAACGVSVVVSKLSQIGNEMSDDRSAWVAFPAEVARRALSGNLAAALL